MVKAVFFDFWGTLVENGTYSPLKQSYNILRVRMPFGEFVEKFEQSVMTKKFADQTAAFTEACLVFGVPTYPIVIEKLIGVWNKNRLLAKLYPDTLEALKLLKEKKIKLAVVSNAPQNNVEQVIERFDIKDYFDGVFISANEGVLKTDGLFDTALKKLKIKKADALAVGDTIETDIKGAEDAGISAYLIDRKGKREFAKKITDLNEIIKLVE